MYSMKEFPIKLKLHLSDAEIELECALEEMSEVLKFIPELIVILSDNVKSIPNTRTNKEIRKEIRENISKKRKLLDKELIEISGKSEKVGRPLIYNTSEKFMDYFGINNLNQLPTLKDFRKEKNTIGDEQEL